LGHFGGADRAEKIEVVPDQDDAEGGKLGKSRRRKIGEEMITNLIEIVD
jgi:hypothetical protein